MEYHRTIWMGFTHYFSHVNATPFVFQTEPPRSDVFFSLLFKWIYLFIAFSELDIIVFPIFCFRYLPAFCWKILLPCHCMHPKYDKYGITAYYSIVCSQHSNKAMDDKNKVKKETVRRFSRVLWVKNMCWPNDIRKRNKNKTATVILCTKNFLKMLRIPKCDFYNK